MPSSSSSSLPYRNNSVIENFARVYNNVLTFVSTHFMSESCIKRTDVLTSEAEMTTIFVVPNISAPTRNIRVHGYFTQTQ